MAAHPESDPAEQSLLALLRPGTINDFMLMVTCDTDRWTVAMEDFQAGTKVLGQGDSFAEAWANRTEVST